VVNVESKWVVLCVIWNVCQLVKKSKYPEKVGGSKELPVRNELVDLGLIYQESLYLHVWLRWRVIFIGHLCCLHFFLLNYWLFRLLLSLTGFDYLSDEYFSYKLIEVILILHGVRCGDDMLYLIFILSSLGLLYLGLQRGSTSRISILLYVLECKELYQVLGLERIW
jgi:hypothetical protein